MPSPAYSIRPCLPSEASTLCDLGARLFRQAYGVSHPEPDLTPYLASAYDPVRVSAELARPDYRAWFAVDADQQPFGYAVLRQSQPPYPDGLPGTRPAEALRFYVDSSWQGRGVGLALMRRCEAQARDWGADCLWVSAWQRASWAIAFYQRVGFATCGTAIFHFGAREDNDYVMAKALT
ncbi:MAG TPA: GNAT family N-acetyltransferase [Gemmatimonadales bacterium]|nr:GNAT family N-acetyltransferase [Gemmatimonadales bacterium]